MKKPGKRKSADIVTSVPLRPVDNRNFEACLERVVEERREVLRRLAQGRKGM